MEKRSKRWSHDDCSLVNPEGRKFPFPLKMLAWSEDMKRWPAVDYRDIFNYLVLSEGVDGEEMKNYKSLDSYQYFHAHKVGTVLLHELEPGLCFLKAEVTPSQSVNNEKLQAWVRVRSDGAVETAGCTCIAGRGKSCSHAGAILWKLEYAKSTGRSGVSCTDQQQQWNRGTLRNMEPHQLQEISFTKKHRHSSLENEGVVVNDNLERLPVYLTHEQFVKAATESSVSKFFQLTGSMANKAYKADVCTQPVTAVERHDGVLSCDLCRTFYASYVDVDGQRKMELEEVTKKQSECEAWRDGRKLGNNFKCCQESASDGHHQP